MTGSEIIPVAKAATKALSEDSKTKQQLVEIAKDSPAIQAAAESHARQIAVRQALMLKVFSPFRKLVGLPKEYFETDFAHDMGAKLEPIPEEHLVTPKLVVAVPAMEALGYSLDEPTLKDMYLTLLATASDERVREQAHPAFAEIIRQLTAEEAELIGVMLRFSELPIVRIVENVDPNAFNILRTHVLDLTDDILGPTECPMSSVYVDNWVRLGLAEVDYLTAVFGEHAYDWADLRPELDELRRQAGEGADRIDVQHGYFRRTAFGELFVNAVLP